MSGTAIEGIEKVGGCDVLSAEITTNRPDCLSLAGIANELSALTGKKIKKITTPKIKTPSQKHPPLKIKILDRKGCPAYTARVLDAVQVGPSPAWLVNNLAWMGQKSVNNVVDITNFCLFELGQPLHAFDYDKIEGKNIIVRRAKKGEKMIGIDGVVYALDEGILVIADARKPIAVAGVIGGQDTQVTENTRRIALESARFNPILVRHAVRTLKVTTDSSYRFERTVDPQKVVQASDRAAHLIQTHAKAVVASPLLATGGTKSAKASWVTLRKESLDRVMCGVMPLSQAARILSRLGLEVRKTSPRLIKVRTTSGRLDLQEEMDLIEEVIRIYGFEKIPTRIPLTRHSLATGLEFREYETIRRLKASLVSQGLWEVVTYSLVSGNSLSKIHFPTEEAVLKITNPLSQEQEFLQPLGLTGILDTISHNVNRKEKDLQVFEISKRFLKLKEEGILSIAITGAFHQSWDGVRESSFYHLKGIVENVFRSMKKEMPAWTVDTFFPQTFSENLSLVRGKTRLVSCSAVRPDVLANWDLITPVYYAEIVLDEFFKGPDIREAYAELPRYPAVRRDIAIVIDKKFSVAQIEACLLEAGGGDLTRMSLFDQYLGKPIPKNKRSLAFTLQYQKPGGTFTDEEINLIHARIVSALKTRFQIELR